MRSMHLIGICAALALGAAASVASAYSPGKLYDGKTPDLRGIWQARGTAYVNIEGHKGGKGVAPSRSIIVDPADGKIPYKPEALAKRDENFRNRNEADPSLRCSQAGVPRITYLPTPFQIVQSPGYTAFVYQDNHSYRIIYPSTKPHLTGVDWWMGDSRGHWEGDTLVVDVTTQNDLTWLDASGNPHSSDIHVVERYTPTGPDTMTYEARIEDPNTYTRPWTLRTTLYRNTAKGARIIEDECLEDIHGVFRHISPTDPANLLRNNYRRWLLPADGAAPANK
ncbi:MAG: hypothetical protein QM696_13055 [Steroidobacteraceae bacterium]